MKKEKETIINNEVLIKKTKTAVKTVCKYTKKGIKKLYVNINNVRKTDGYKSVRGTIAGCIIGTVMVGTSIAAANVAKGEDIKPVLQDDKTLVDTANWTSTGGGKIKSGSFYCDPGYEGETTLICNIPFEKKDDGTIIYNTEEYKSQQYKYNLDNLSKNDLKLLKERIHLSKKGFIDNAKVKSILEHATYTTDEIYVHNSVPNCYEATLYEAIPNEEYQYIDKDVVNGHKYSDVLLGLSAGLYTFGTGICGVMGYKLTKEGLKQKKTR